MNRTGKIVIAYLLLIVSFFFMGKPFGFFCNGASIGIFLHDLFVNVMKDREDEKKK